MQVSDTKPERFTLNTQAARLWINNPKILFYWQSFTRFTKIKNLSFMLFTGQMNMNTKLIIFFKRIEELFVKIPIVGRNDKRRFAHKKNIALAEWEGQEPRAPHFAALL
ncbi:hypothetical protein GQ457_17G022040 [Hibiscus cannabinus]